MFFTTKLSVAFVEVADTLVDDFDVVDFLNTLAQHAVAVSGAAAWGLLLADHNGRLQFMAATDEDVRSLELYQLQHAEGRDRVIGALNLFGSEDHRFDPRHARAVAS